MDMQNCGSLDLFNMIISPPNSYCYILETILVTGWYQGKIKTLIESAKREG